MAKKPITKPAKSIKPAQKTETASSPDLAKMKLPPEMEEKLKALKSTLDKFKDKVLEKFGDYIVGITLLPPEKPAEKPKEENSKEKAEERKINVLVVVDDTTSQKMSKEELYAKFSTIIKTIG